MFKCFNASCTSNGERTLISCFIYYVIHTCYSHVQLFILFIKIDRIEACTKNDNIQIWLALKTRIEDRYSEKPQPQQLKTLPSRDISIWLQITPNNIDIKHHILIRLLERKKNPIFLLHFIHRFTVKITEMIYLSCKFVEHWKLKYLVVYFFSCFCQQLIDSLNTDRKCRKDVCTHKNHAQKSHLI